MAAPGKSFMEMLELILANHRRPFMPFSPQLLMAIFWEESLFSNIQQITKKGTGPAVGFGQVERQELPKLSTAQAQSLGYFVPGMTSGISTLPDDLAVQVSSCMLLHLFHGSESKTDSGRKAFALRGYSGNRQSIIDGWLACEAALLKLPFTVFKIINNAGPLSVFEDQVMNALSLTRGFNRNAQVNVVRNGRTQAVAFREVLFPLYWFFPPMDITRMTAFLPAGKVLQQGSTDGDVGFLQQLLNAQRNMGLVEELKADSVFGPKTEARVRLFQTHSGAGVDGVVGQETRGKLIPV